MVSNYDAAILLFATPPPPKGLRNIVVSSRAGYVEEVVDMHNAVIFSYNILYIHQE